MQSLVLYIDKRSDGLGASEPGHYAWSGKHFLGVQIAYPTGNKGALHCKEWVLNVEERKTWNCMLVAMDAGVHWFACVGRWMLQQRR